MTKKISEKDEIKETKEKPKLPDKEPLKMTEVQLSRKTNKRKQKK